MKSAGRIFEDEYDLALAVINRVEARAQRGEYSTERFLFNSAWLLISNHFRYAIHQSPRLVRPVRPERQS